MDDERQSYAERQNERMELLRRQVEAHERMASAQEQIAGSLAEISETLGALFGSIEEIGTRIPHAH